MKIKLFYFLGFIFVLHLSCMAQVVNDDCSNAIDYGTLDGRKRCICPDGRITDTSFVVSNKDAIPNFPYYNTSNFCYTGHHDTINSLYNDVWYKFKPNGIIGMSIFNMKLSSQIDTIKITYWLDDGSGCGHFYGGVTQIVPLINNYFYYEFGYFFTGQYMYLQFTGIKPKDTINLSICLSGSKFGLTQPPICCLMSPSFDSVCFLNTLTNTKPSSINSKDGSITSSVSLGHPPYKYLWSTGDTSYKIQGLKAGKYYLTITDSIGCINKYTIDLTSTSSILNSYELENLIYPNPARDYVLLSFPSSNLTLREPTIILYNLLGQAIPLQIQKEGIDKLRIDISALPMGIYLLKLINRDGEEIHRDKIEVRR